jgi:hypothetical protein
MNDQELIQIIRTSNNPDALAIAASVIIEHLRRHGSSEAPSAVVQPALD